MAENENRVSAVQEAPDSPQEPAALDTPPSDMPVYEPARPVRRVAGKKTSRPRLLSRIKSRRGLLVYPE